VDRAEATGRHLLSVVDSLFHSGYTPFVEWEIEYTDEFGAWWSSLTEDEQVDFDALDCRAQIVAPCSQSSTKI